MVNKVARTGNTYHNTSYKLPKYKPAKFSEFELSNRRVAESTAGTRANGLRESKAVSSVEKIAAPAVEKWHQVETTGDVTIID